MKILLRVIWQCKGVGEGTRQPRDGSPPHSTVSSHVNISASALSAFECGHQGLFVHICSFQPSDLSTESARRGAGQL